MKPDEHPSNICERCRKPAAITLTVDHNGKPMTLCSKCWRNK
jgi:hypothetical protein